MTMTQISTPLLFGYWMQTTMDIIRLTRLHNVHHPEQVILLKQIKLPVIATTGTKSSGNLLLFTLMATATATQQGLARRFVMEPLFPPATPLQRVPWRTAAMTLLPFIPV